MPSVEVDNDTYRELTRLADDWHTTIADVVDRCVYAVARGIAVCPPPAPPLPGAVHGFYAGYRIDAIFEPDSHHVTMRSGPLRGQSFTSPSAARSAVVAALNPTVSPTGNGWSFWRITPTGARLETLRRQGEPHP